MTYVDPQGNRTAAVPTDSQNVPVVDVSASLSLKPSPPGPIPHMSTPPLASAKTISSASLPANEFCKFIELEVLKIIKNLYEKGITPQERIQGMARNALELIRPGMTLEELYRNAVKLDDQYSELGPLVMKIMREYEEKYEKKAINQVSALIKTKQYDEAQNLVKKVLQFKMNT